jgi:hypothetical protein
MMTCLIIKCCRNAHVELDAEMCMLSWICGYTRDRIRNDDIRNSLGVAPIKEKLIVGVPRPGGPWADE